MTTSHGRLNIFQRLVRQWDALHPYNAAQVVKIQGKPDLKRLCTSWHDALAALGLGRARTDGRTFHFECLNGALAADAVHHAVGVPLETLLSQELNRRFDDAADPTPFRPFVIDSPEGDHHVGIVYHHWVADSVSIRELLRQWFLHWHDPDRARREPLKLATRGYWSLFGPEGGGWRLGEGLLSSMRWTSRSRRVRRMSEGTADEGAQAVSIRRAEDGLIEILRKIVRPAGVTLHDLLLAAAAEACDKHLPLHRHAQRHDLAMGTIVDLRPSSRTDLSDTFGMFLGFTTTLCKPEELAHWSQLLRTVASQGRQHKDGGHPQASVIRMAAGLAASRVLSREQMIDFYRKRVPLAGGTSSVNLAGTWAAEYHPAPVLEYIRASPTGPMMPLVFSMTRLGRQFNLCLTRRSAAVSEAMATEILNTFFARLDYIAQCGNAFGRGR